MNMPQKHATKSTSEAANTVTVYSLFREQARRHPEAVALRYGERKWSYQQLLQLVEGVAIRLTQLGLTQGDRVAILSENRPEYTVVQLAAARMGYIVACLNWRLGEEEQHHCVSLVEPRVLLHSARFKLPAQQLMESRAPYSIACLLLEDIAHHDHLPETLTDPPEIDPESGLLLLYTSGTTGLPKAALISHRAEIARMTVLRLDLKITRDDAYIAWSPMFHMGGTEHTLASLMFGAMVIITDGLDLPAMIHAMANYRLGWLLLVPATIEPLLEEMSRRSVRVLGIKCVGCMADLVPGAVIAQATRRLNAPFLNSFGATETGLPPATGHLIPIGETPNSLSKHASSLCEIRLLDKAGVEVANGLPGEVHVRGPTVFSGYWTTDGLNCSDFHKGWFCMGDLFCKTPAGHFDFVGRTKYLIKSGGENIYPAEIERVLLADPRIADAIVVRKADPRWGEIPVAFVATNTEDVTVLDIEMLCRRKLAGFKRPKEVRFLALQDFPRSATGKIIREELELRLKQEPGELNQ